MSDDSSNFNWPMKIIIKAVGNIALVWILAVYMKQYFALTGGFPAYIIVGSLLTLLNMFIRPILDIVTLPFKLFATIIAIIIVNGVFVQLTHMIVQNMKPDLVTLEIYGGLWGWTVIAVVFGFTNWVLKEIMHK
ncbi:MAG: phage holin family protein [Candidatus Peribacteraceae bacterium]|nr:phage holin family protein [Candidatus Peribacteraceae bacterium]MDP7454885.1 phage holin family protein [Candidatus Peribacteraceae bacterium]MDP7646177.1 phage holin family protein [Candidatus Peribacteraceae bacterium]